MGETKGFLKYKRATTAYRPACERVKDFRDVMVARAPEKTGEQASRCMDCGTPFCHWGCPVGNYIPEWNDLASRGKWERAFQLLDATNNLPEITGRICPATCEYACVLGINDDPVTIRENELDIIEQAFAAGLLRPQPPRRRTGKTVAVVGSGPAGLACADQLNSVGHTVVVFERDDKIGGIMRYGIPDFKLEKCILDRRIGLLEKEGIEFQTGVHVGQGYPAVKLLSEFDALCLAAGSRLPRDLNIEGRDLGGIHFAMEYLIQANRRISGEVIPDGALIDAAGKKVVVIGGGDTGADCVGVAHRQGASCVLQIELLARPPECRANDSPWPKYPFVLKTSTSHEEGGERKWAVLTKKFIGEKGRVKKLSCVQVEFERKDLKTCPAMREVAGSEFSVEADLAILALGFLSPEPAGMLAQLGVSQDSRGNVKTGEDFHSSVKKVFSCGDMRRGQSLIVWAISEGRKAAYHIDHFLSGRSSLPLL